MFGSDAKVSLHSTGECQWSATDSWVKKVPGRRNAERQFAKWTIPWPNPSEALHVFQIRIPDTELRTVNATEDLTSIEWLATPDPGKTTSLECYITPLSTSDPTISTSLPHPCLISTPLSDGRWFVVLNHMTLLNGRDLDALRAEICEDVRAPGFEPKPEHRAVFFTKNDGVVRGLIEVCPIAA